jgi:hypothetical protein
MALIVITGGAAWAGAPYESAVRSINKQVFAIDKELDRYTKTSVDHCEELACTRTVSYWDTKGRLRKTAEELRTKAGPGTVTGRYYVDCQLILARVTPNDTEAVKDPRSIEKFYFHKDKLLRVVVGDEIQTFGKDQMAYYERSQRSDPAKCTQDVR